MFRCIPFFGTVLAASEKTLSSGLLSFGYRTEEVQIGFPVGSDRLVQVKVFIGSDGTEPASGEPGGVNVFELAAHVAYIVGDDVTLRIPVEMEMRERNSFIKVYANNTDVFNHTIDVRVILNTL